MESVDRPIYVSLSLDAGQKDFVSQITASKLLL